MRFNLIRIYNLNNVQCFERERVLFIFV